MSTLCNLVVELDARFDECAVPAGIEIAAPAAADERTLAWIDEIFEGSWSGEAVLGTNVVARRGDAPAGFATFDAQGLRFAWLRGLARERDVGFFGPFGVAPAERKSGLSVALLHRALSGLRERGYTRALIPAVGGERLVRYYAGAVGARVAEEYERDALLGRPARTIVMASGSGSNFQALAEVVRDGRLPLDPIALVSNAPGAYALERAHAAGVPTRVVAWERASESRAAYDARLLDAVAALRPELVVLLGWMHLLSPQFVAAFPDLLNLHPAFLPLDPSRDDVCMPDGTRVPAFRGAHAVRDALAAASAWTGATLHRVTADTDRGQVLARRPLRIEPSEDEEAVDAARPRHRTPPRSYGDNALAFRT